MPAITTSRSRLVPAIAAALAAAALVPAGAAAATTTFGSSLDHAPANAGSTCAEDGVSGPALCTHVGSFYPGFSGRAQSPVNGTVEQLRLRPAGPITFRAEIVNVRHLSADHQSGQAQAVVRSRQISVPGPTQAQIDNGDFPVVTVNVHLKVKRGQELAIDTTSNTAEYCSDGTPGQLLFDPVLSLGHGFSSSQGTDDCLLLFQAVVKH